MDKNLESLWNSYFVQNMKNNLRNMYQGENELSEQMINKIASLCGADFAKHFVAWLYDYVTFKERIAFEVGYTIAKKQ